MTYEDLKNIGWYVPDRVEQFAREHAESYRNNFCTWVQIYDNEIVFRTYGFRTMKGKFKLTEVVRATPALEMCVTKNIYLTSMSGYRVVYEPKTVYSSYSYHIFDKENFDRWYTEYVPGIQHTILNATRILECEKYKFCGLSDTVSNALEYLKAYNRNPGVEFFGKIGVFPQKSLVSKATKDRKFLRFLRDHAAEVNSYGASATIYAYGHSMGIKEATIEQNRKRKVSRYVCECCPEIKGTKLDREKVQRYIESDTKRKWSTYNDYLKAVVYLGLNLEDTKNAFPNDLQRMHDMRAHEYEAAKARADREKRAQLYKEFSEACKQYEKLAMASGKYMAVIPGDISDLVNEGDKLHHCVGRMGYDSKVANGVSIIVFIRRIDEPEKPFVTVEYIKATNKVAQCYADHDSKPEPEVIEWVNEWAVKTKELLAS